MFPAAPSVAANTTEYRDIGVPELVMNCLAPLSTHPSPSRRATVLTLEASLPPEGSVSEKALNASPEESSESSASRRSGWSCSNAPSRTALTTATCTVTASEEST